PGLNAADSTTMMHTAAVSGALVATSPAPWRRPRSRLARRTNENSHNLGPLAAPRESGQEKNREEKRPGDGIRASGRWHARRDRGRRSKPSDEIADARAAERSEVTASRADRRPPQSRFFRIPRQGRQIDDVYKQARFSCKETRPAQTCLVGLVAERGIMRTEEADAEVLKPGGEHSGTGDDDAGDNHHSGSGGNQRESIATQLLNMCSAAGVTLFHDDEAESYATIDVRGHKETHPLTSPGFRSWLVHLYDTQVKLAPNAQAIKDALATLSSRAHYDGPRQNVATRVGKHDDQIFIDLGDDEWSIIKIDAHGWRLIPYADCAVRFRRPAKMKSLPMPVAAGASIDLLRRFANVSDAEWPLILGYLLQALRGAGPYPVLV